MKADLFTQLRELCAAIEDYANAPFEFVGDMEAKVRSVNNAVSSMEDTYAKRTEEAQNEVETLLTDPGASRAGRLLRDLQDTVNRAVGDKLSKGPVIFTKTFGQDATLFGIAVTEGMDLQRLFDLNPGLDPFMVLANTPVSLEK